MDYFLSVNPIDPSPLKPIDTDSLTTETKQILGEKALSLLSKYGEATFGNGLFRILHPERNDTLLSFWKLPKDRCVPFLISSFGTLFFYTQKKFGYIIPAYNDVSIETKMEIGLVFDLLLADAEALNASCFKDIHDAVFPRLGSLNKNEIYAFVPALGLGGGKSAENVEKVKIQVQFSILSQL